MSEPVTPEPERKIRSSRQLLFAAALPPMSHAGVTLLRHVCNTGLRFALYQLGFPLPEKAPFYIVQLRLFFDVQALEEAVAQKEGGQELLGAVIDPGGATPGDQRSLKLGGAAGFHRARLRLRPPRPPRIHRLHRSAGFDDETSPWQLFRERLSAWLPYLSDLLLVEVLSSLGRRRARGQGKERPPALGSAAFGLLGENIAAAADPALGPADLLHPSWTVEEALQARRDALGRPGHSGGLVPGHGRGEFREGYRRALEVLREPFLELARRASDKGLIAEPSEAFFLPLDLVEDLGGETPEDWISVAVKANRHEFESTHYQTTPPDRLSQGSRILGAAQPDPDWVLAPLQPLP